MPRRPPKEWFRSCERRVKGRSPDVTDPAAVCGALWARKMGPAAKEKALAEEGARYCAVCGGPHRKHTRRGVSSPPSEEPR